jgi:hypothetical protein
MDEEKKKRKFVWLELSVIAVFMINAIIAN